MTERTASGIMAMRRHSEHQVERNCNRATLKAAVRLSIFSKRWMACNSMVDFLEQSVLFPERIVELQLLVVAFAQLGLDARLVEGSRQRRRQHRTLHRFGQNAIGADGGSAAPFVNERGEGGRLFYRYRLGQITRLIDIGAANHRDMV